MMVALLAVYLIRSIVSALSQGGTYAAGDFFAIWSYAQALGGHTASFLYDHSGLHAYQTGLGMPADDANPFAYPPVFMLLLRPLQGLGIWVALAIWVGAGVAAYGVAMLAGRAVPAVLGWGALLAPTTTLTIVAGQGGLFAGALLVGGVRLMDRRPWLSGLLFGLLTYRPQLGLLIPVALVAAGAWRCIAGACLTAAVMSAATIAMFGWGVWPAWIASLPAYQAMFARAMAGHHMVITVAANVAALGAPPWLADAVQAGTGLGCAAIVWASFRRGPRELAGVVLLAATCLATPHALLYDLPVLTGAVLAYAAFRMREGGALDGLELLSIAAVLVFPAVMGWAATALPISGPAMVSFLVVVMRQRRRSMGLIGREIDRLGGRGGFHPPYEGGVA
jgi:hypothetical protein